MSGSPFLVLLVGLQLINFQIFHGTYAALCRKKGVHTSQADGVRDWNRELGQCISDTLEPAWENIRREWPSSLTHLSHNVAMAFGDLTNRLQACDNSPSFAISHLIEAIMGPTEDRILDRIEIFRKNVMAEMEYVVSFDHSCPGGLTNLRSIRKRMLYHDKSDSFIQKFMHPIYDKCHVYRGVGSDGLRKKTMTDHFDEGDPFHTYYKTTERFYQKKVMGKFTELHETVKKECEETLMGIQQMTANEDEPAEAQLDRETARKILVCLGAAEPALEDAKNIFETVKRNFNAGEGAIA
ncbi:uncharacterized protein N7459_001706 [Penicillium hispanicum]|uniref:uncharacterized protein n=1 Tax=Penicillium hispanicum TaxID=1080232 RepID=UPI002540241A|nr:uncharacterized protein N7459_001706 [Penicillium hispanicum]KAJ5595498.1 hypothetical protein N7459_001706 [Penicillium hispanicum]